MCAGSAPDVPNGTKNENKNRAAGARKADTFNMIIFKVPSVHQRRPVSAETSWNLLKITSQSFASTFFGAKYISNMSQTHLAAKIFSISKKFQTACEISVFFVSVSFLQMCAAQKHTWMPYYVCTRRAYFIPFGGSLIIPDRNAPGGWCTELTNTARAGGRPV